MKKLVLILTVFAAIAALYAAQNIACANYACGLKPLPPLGCSMSDAVCICDNAGNCQWVWICN